MSDAQILAWFDHEREDGAVPNLTPADPGPRYSARGLFEKLCFSRGITEREDVDRLWAADQERRAAQKRKLKERPQPQPKGRQRPQPKRR